MQSDLLLEHDADYKQASQPANTRYDDIRPQVVARCGNAADVAVCIEWAQANNVPLVARGGGHSYAGYSTTTGLLIDVGRLKSVEIHEDGTATIGGGALNRDIFAATVDRGFVLPGGTCPSVGVGGLVLGGGVGYNSQWAGLTCDHLTASDIVVAGGTKLKIDGSHARDLFWACRGGAGGSFGINTSFTFKLVPVPSNVFYYRFEYAGVVAARKVLLAFEQMMSKAPPELSAVASFTAVADGRDIAIVSRGQYLGERAGLEDLVKDLRELRPVRDTLEKKSYWETQKIFITDEGPRHSFGDISRYSKKPLSEKAVDKVVGLLLTCPSRSRDTNGSFWSLGWVGGKVNQLEPTDTAYVHRGMSTLLRATPTWATDTPEDDQKRLIAWTNQVIDAIRDETVNESYQNFPNRAIDDWREQYYGENFAELLRVKTKYDPDNVFQNAQSIRRKP